MITSTAWKTAVQDTFGPGRVTNLATELAGHPDAPLTDDYVRHLAIRVHARRPGLARLLTKLTDGGFLTGVDPTGSPAFWGVTHLTVPA